MGQTINLKKIVKNCIKIYEFVENWEELENGTGTKHLDNNARK